MVFKHLLESHTLPFKAQWLTNVPPSLTFITPHFAERVYLHVSRHHNSKGKAIQFKPGEALRVPGR